MSTVLVVDDDQLILRAWQRALRGKGKRVLVTMDAGEAHELATSEQPELVVVDLLLGGGVSGIDLVEELREVCRDAFIVLISGVGTADDWTAAQDVGVDLAIRKPVDIQALLERVEHGTRLPRCLGARVASPRRVKWEHLRHVYNAVGGNMTRAANLLGMRRQALQQQLEKQPPR